MPSTALKRRSSVTRHRTQLYLDQGLHSSLRLAAKRKKKSTAAIVREALEEYLSREATDEDDPFLQLGTSGTRTGILDASEDVDRYLHAKRKSR